MNLVNARQQRRGCSFLFDFIQLLWQLYNSYERNKIRKSCKRMLLSRQRQIKKKFHSSSYINTKISFHYIKTLLKILIAFMLLTNATATELFSQIIIRSSAELFFWYIENVSSLRTFNFQNFHWCFCLIWTYVEFSNIGVHKYFLEFAKIDILLDFSRWYSM